MATSAAADATDLSTLGAAGPGAVPTVPVPSAPPSSLRPAVSPYTISKWGLRGPGTRRPRRSSATASWSTASRPGPMAAPMLLGDDRSDLDLETSPPGRHAAPEEVANMAVVPVGDLGRMVAGDVVYVTGGCGNLTYDDMGYVF